MNEEQQNMNPMEEKNSNEQNSQIEQVYVKAPVKKSSKGMAIAALVCGILGLIGGWIPVVCWFTFPLAILGIIFGARSLKVSKEVNEGHGLATAGLVCGIIGTVIGGIGILCVSLCMSAGCAAANAADNAVSNFFA